MIAPQMIPESKIYGVEIPIAEKAFEIMRSDRGSLIAVGYPDQDIAEETYLTYLPLKNYEGIRLIETINPYNFDGKEWVYKLDRKRTRDPSKIVRDANGRFARVPGSGTKTTKEKKSKSKVAQVKAPKIITKSTNIAQLKSIAEELGVEIPTKNVNRKKTWYDAISSSPEGKKRFGASFAGTSATTKKSTEKTSRTQKVATSKTLSNLSDKTTVKDLKATAREKGVKIPAAARKAEILKQLKKDPKTADLFKEQPTIQKATEKKQQTKTGPTEEKITKKTKTSAGRGESFLKSKLINPYAISDITPDQFNDFKDKREFLEYNDSPDFVGNQSYEQWKAAKIQESSVIGEEASLGGVEYGTGIKFYRSAVKDAIRDGYKVDDIALEKVKLSKSEQQQLQTNRKNYLQNTKDVAKVQRAINAPLVDEATVKKHKPKMTEAEANEFTKDSFTNGLSFYHGNQNWIVSDVENNGAKPEKNRRGIFGQGFYLATNPEEARLYAVTSDVMQLEGNLDSSVISTKVNVKNPLVTNSKDWEELSLNFPGDQDNGVDSKALTEFVRTKGYDSIYLKDFGYTVVLDGRQVVTYDSSPTTQEQAKFIKDNITKMSHERTAELTKNSETGKAMAEAKEWQQNG